MDAALSFLEKGQSEQYNERIIWLPIDGAGFPLFFQWCSPFFQDLCTLYRSSLLLFHCSFTNQAKKTASNTREEHCPQAPLDEGKCAIQKWPSWWCKRKLSLHYLTHNVLLIGSELSAIGPQWKIRNSQIEIFTRKTKFREDGGTFWLPKREKTHDDTWKHKIKQTWKGNIIS